MFVQYGKGWANSDEFMKGRDGRGICLEYGGKCIQTSIGNTALKSTGLLLLSGDETQAICAHVVIYCRKCSRYPHTCILRHA